MARYHNLSAALRFLSVVGLVTWATTSGRVGGPDASAASPAPSASSASSASQLTEVVCPTVRVCEAAGTNRANTLGILFGSTDGGLRWERQVLPPGISQISSVVCPSVITCEAVGFAKSSGTALRTTNGGHTWLAQKLTPGTTVGAISCPTVSVCEAVGDNGALRTTTGGMAWTAQGVPSVAYNLAGIDCSRVLTCEAFGSSSGFNPVGVVIGTNNGGATWRAQHIPTKQSPAAISCPSPTTCEIALSAPFFGGPASGQALRTTDGGLTWVQQRIVDGVIASGISCPALGTCEAVGGTAISSVAVRSTDGGATWNLRALFGPSISKTLEAQDVACPALDTCVLVGSLVSGRSSVAVTARTTDGGKKWSINLP